MTPARTVLAIFVVSFATFLLGQGCSSSGSVQPSGATGGGGPSACGNGVCDPGETCMSCSDDCGDCPQKPPCGDGKCEPGEDACSCPQDCHGACCGNEKCEGGESCTSCPGDCGQCPMKPPCGD